MFLDLFFGLREAGVKVGMQEWQGLMTALEKSLHGQSLAALLLPGARLPGEERGVLRRLRPRVREGLPRRGRLPRRHRASCSSGCATRRTSAELTPEQRELLERLSRDELMRRFLETLEKQDGRHDGGGRWIGTGGHSPFGHGGEHPTRDPGRRPGPEPLGDEGLGGAPLPRLPHRRDPRPAPVEGRAAAPPPPDARRRGHGARPRRDHRRDLPQRRRDRARVPRAAAQQRAAAAADGRRRDDGPVLRADEPAA